MLEVGIKGREEVKVTKDNTAKALGSGELDVFATPAMIALMEKTAWKSVAAEVGEGNGTVGTLLNISHLSASPLGANIVCESELVEVKGRELVFKVKAFDEKGLIGEGEHRRFVVNNEKFQTKANNKLN
ncbi:MAG: thioesterase family protein [Clostridiales bacterium]|nr:thioesterase family protein [Clostridiales bacterium]